MLWLLLLLLSVVIVLVVIVVIGSDVDDVKEAMGGGESVDSALCSLVQSSLS